MHLRSLLLVVATVGAAFPLARAQELSPAPSASIGVSGLAAPTGTPGAPASSASPAAVAGSVTGQPEDAEIMKQMMELSKTNENHKLLGTLAGTWTYTVKMWMAPNAPPLQSSGTGVRKAMMNGRYFLADYTGKIKMPGPDGKLQDMDFKGLSLEGYDNVKKKFVSTWSDNMGTGIMMSEGDYDPATKTFTFTGEYEMMPGMKINARELLKVVDANHHTLEWYEDRGGQSVKTMEINYSRK